jgi:hypothetical protein
MGASPQVADWDEDGDWDLLSGESNGYITLFRNIGTETEPVLTNEGHIQANGYDIDVGSLSVPVIDDWDEDGRKDLIVGCDTGYVYVYLNTGSNTDPVFGSAFKILADGVEIRKMKNYPEVADMNGDGLKDLVMSWIDGSCLFWPNYNTNSDPVFYENYELVGFTDPLDPGPGEYNWSHMEVCDWNEDGYPDILYTRWESEVFIHLNAFGLLDISVEPVDAPVVIPPEGGSFRCRVTVSNYSEETAIMDGWNEVILPVETLYGPMRILDERELPGGDDVEIVFRQHIPGTAPEGTYYYRVCIGNSGNGFFLSDNFPFEKK